MPNDPKKARAQLVPYLYSEKIYNGNNENAFLEDFESDEKRRELHQFLQESNRYTKSYNDFNRQFFGDVNETVFETKKKELQSVYEAAKNLYKGAEQAVYKTVENIGEVLTSATSNTVSDKKQKINQAHKDFIYGKLDVEEGIFENPMPIEKRFEQKKQKLKEEGIDWSWQDELNYQNSDEYKNLYANTKKEWEQNNNMLLGVDRQKKINQERNNLIATKDNADKEAKDRFEQKKYYIEIAGLQDPAVKEQSLQQAKDQYRNTVATGEYLISEFDNKNNITDKYVSPYDKDADELQARLYPQPKKIGDAKSNIQFETEWNKQQKKAFAEIEKELYATRDVKADIQEQNATQSILTNFKKGSDILKESWWYDVSTQNPDYSLNKWLEIAEKHIEKNKTWTTEEKASMRSYLFERLRTYKDAKELEENIDLGLSKIGLPTPKEIAKNQEESAKLLMSEYTALQKDAESFTLNMSKKTQAIDQEYNTKSKEFTELSKTDYDAFSQNIKKNLDEKIKLIESDIKLQLQKGLLNEKQANEIFAQQQEPLIAEANKALEQRYAQLRDAGENLYKNYIQSRSDLQSQVVQKQSYYDQVSKSFELKVANLSAEVLKKFGETPESYKKKYETLANLISDQTNIKNKLEKDALWKSLSYPDRIALSLSNGLLNIAEPFFGGVKYFAPSLSMPDFQMVRIDSQRQLRPQADFGEFNYSQLTNPDWWIKNAGEQVPMMMSLMIPGVAAYRTALTASSLTGLSLATRQGIASIVGGASSRVFESAFEAGTTILESLKQGDTYEEAVDKFNNVYAGNMALMLTDAMQMYLTFAKTPKIVAAKGNGKLATTISSTINTAGKTALVFQSGGYEELWQEYLQAKQHNPLLTFHEFQTSPEGKEVYAIGGLMESSMHVFGGGLYDRSAIAQINRSIRDLYSDMDSKKVSMEDIKSRAYMLNNIISTLQERGVLSEKEILDAREKLQFSTEMFEMAKDGLLPFDYNDPKFDSYSSMMYERNKAQEDINKLKKETAKGGTTAIKAQAKIIQLEKMVANLDSNINSLVDNKDEHTYSYDGVPITLSEFESLAFGPENAPALLTGMLDTDDPLMQKRMMKQGRQALLSATRAEALITRETAVTGKSQPNAPRVQGEKPETTKKQKGVSGTDKEIINKADELISNKQTRIQELQKLLVDAVDNKEYSKLLTEKRRLERDVNDLNYYKNLVVEQQKSSQEAQKVKPALTQEQTIEEQIEQTKESTPDVLPAEQLADIQENQEIEFKEPGILKTKKGKKINIEGYEDVDLIVVENQEGLITDYDVYELSSGKMVAQGKYKDINEAKIETKKILDSKFKNQENLLDQLVSRYESSQYDTTKKQENQSPAIEKYKQKKKEEYEKKPYILDETERIQINNVARMAEQEGFATEANMIRKMAEYREGSIFNKENAVENAKRILEDARKNRSIEEAKAKQKPLEDNNKKILDDSLEAFIEAVNEGYKTPQFDKIYELTQEQLYDIYKKSIAIHNKYGYYIDAFKNFNTNAQLIAGKLIRAINSSNIETKADRIKEVLEELNKHIEEINDLYNKEILSLETATPKTYEATQKGFEQSVDDAIVDTVITKEQADALKKTTLAAAKNWAKRTGKSVDEFYQKFNPKVTRAKSIESIEGEPYYMTMPDGSQSLVRKIDADVVNGFYSPLEAKIAQLKNEKYGSGEQAWNELKSKGLKDDEVKWTGIEDWLKSQGKITKQDIYRFIKENKVEIVEVVKGGKYILNENWTPGIEENKGTGKIWENNGWKVVENSNSDYSIFYPNGSQLEGSWETKEGAFGRVKLEASTGTAKFSPYQLEGEKENYKEIMVILPRTGSMAKVGDYKVPLAHRYGEDLPDNRRLVHLRMNTRTDADGKKVLFLEEVQSDWGQTGKKEGFSKNLKELPPNYRIKKIRTYDSILGEYIFEVIDGEGNLRASGNTEAEAKENALKYLNKKATSEAPFVTDTNSWVKLGLKVALKEAVAQGVDKIAWTTGEQQNDRYDLSKQVKQVEWNKYTERGAVKLVTITPITGNPIELPIDENGIVSKNAGTQFDGQRIDNVIGKEIGDKIVSEKSGDLSGNGLKVGGKGMKAFYGSIEEGTKGIVGSVAENVFGQKVGKTNIEILSKVPEGTTIADIIEAGGMQEFKEKNKMLSSQPSIDITPELKASVEQGLPLFQTKKEGIISFYGSFADGEIIGDNILSKADREKLEKEIEEDAESSTGVNMFNNKTGNIAANLYNYDNPIYQKDINGIDARIAEGFIRNGKKTYLLYADGKVVGEYTNRDDAKKSALTLKYKIRQGASISVESKTANEIDSKTGLLFDRSGKPIYKLYDTELVARERFNFEELTKIGSGSDRDVYDLGNGYVVKVAKTARGLEQNIYEGEPYLNVPEVFERGLNYVVVSNIDKAKNSDVIDIYNENNEVIGQSTIGNMIKDLKQFNQRDFDKHNAKLQDVLIKYGLIDFLSYDILYGDFSALKNWGYKNGQVILTDAGTLGGVQMLDNYRNVKNLQDKDFRNVYNVSKRLKKQYGDKDRNTKYQTKDKNVIGAFTFRDGKASAYLFDGATVETLFHEIDPVTGHFGHNVLYDIYDNATEEYKDQAEKDVKTIEEWLGASDRQWTREQHERFVAAGEKYLREGIAPTEELQGVFARLKKWLTDIYNSIINDKIEVNLTEEVKAVFGRMYGAEEIAMSSFSLQEATTQSNTPLDNKKDYERGYRVRDGVQYNRPQPVPNKIVGDSTYAAFTNEIVEDAEYVIMEADDVQQSHYLGNQNLNFFLSFAQPKERAKNEYMRTTGLLKANKLNPALLLTDTMAYYGAPIVNERGEVIQGNGRTEALKVAYNNLPENAEKYKQILKEKAKVLGFTAEDIDKFKKPILVRMLKVDDNKAITLGQYTTQDTEDQGGPSSMAKSKIRRAVPEKVARVLEFLESKMESDEETVSSVIRKSGKELLDLLYKANIINDQEKATGLNKYGKIELGLQQTIENVIYQLVFEGSVSDLSQELTVLPSYIYEGLTKNALKILLLKEDASIKNELHNAILGALEYKLFKDEFGNVSFDMWANHYLSVDPTFVAPAKRFSKVELALIEFMIDTVNNKDLLKTLLGNNASTAPKGFKEFFSQYKQLTDDQGAETDLFGYQKGLSKIEALNRLLNKEINQENNESIETEGIISIEDAQAKNESDGLVQRNFEENGEEKSEQLDAATEKLGTFENEIDGKITFGTDNAIDFFEANLALYKDVNVARENTIYSLQAAGVSDDIIANALIAIDERIKEINKNNGITEDTTDVQIAIENTDNKIILENIADDNNTLLDEVVLPNELTVELIDKLAEYGLIDDDTAFLAKKNINQPNKFTQMAYDEALSKLPELVNAAKVPTKKTSKTKTTTTRKPKQTAEDKPKTKTEKKNKAKSEMDKAKKELEDLLKKIGGGSTNLLSSSSIPIYKILQAAVKYSYYAIDQMMETYANNPEMISVNNWKEMMLKTFGEQVSPFLDDVVETALPPSLTELDITLKEHIENIGRRAKNALEEANKQREREEKGRKPIEAPTTKQKLPKTDSKGAANVRPPLVYVNYEMMPKEVDEYLVEDVFGNDLDEHQRFTVNLALSNWLSNNRKGFLLSDSMGVGKTRQILATAYEYARRTNKKVLIVTQNKQIIETAFKSDAAAMGIDLDKNNIQLITYTEIEKQGTTNYGLVIFDEAHNLKNPSKAFMNAGNLSYDHSMYSTATPGDKIGNAIYFMSDMLNLSRTEMMQELGVFPESKQFGGKDTGQKAWSMRPGRSELNALEMINEYIMEAYRNGSVVRKEYPFWGVKIENTMPLDPFQTELVEMVRLFYDSQIDKVRPGQYFDEKTGTMRTSLGARNNPAYAKRYQGLSEEQKNRVDDEILRELREQKINMMDKLVESFKAKYVAMRIKQDLANNKAVVVVSENVNEISVKGLNEKDPKHVEKMKSFLQNLEDYLIEANIPYVKITGTTDKVQAVKDFQSGKVKVVIGSLDSMAAGINLDDVTGTTPRVLYVASPGYDANAFNQVLGRVSRRNSKTEAEANIIYADTPSETSKKGKVVKKTGILSVYQGEGISDETREQLEESDEFMGAIGEEGPAKEKEKVRPRIETKQGKFGPYLEVYDSIGIKEELKAMGAKWYNNIKAWVINENRREDVEQLIENYMNGTLNKSNSTQNARNQSTQTNQAGTYENQLSDNEHFAVGGSMSRIPVSPISGMTVEQKTQLLYDLMNDLKVFLRYGFPLSRRAAGVYQTINSAITIKMFNDFDVIAHELGHLLDDRFKIAPIDNSLDTELRKFWIYGSSPSPKLSVNEAMKYRRAEGIAELIRAYIYNPTELQRRNPNLYSMIEAKLPIEVLQAVQKFSTGIRALHGMTASEKMSAQRAKSKDEVFTRNTMIQNFSDFVDNMLVRYGFKEKGGATFEQHWSDKLRTNYSDKLWNINKAFKLIASIYNIKNVNPSSDPYILARLFAGVDGKIGNLIKHGLVVRDKIVQGLQSVGVDYRRVMDIPVVKATLTNVNGKLELANYNGLHKKLRKFNGVYDANKNVFVFDITHKDKIQAIIDDYNTNGVPLTLEWLMAPVDTVINAMKIKEFYSKNQSTRHVKVYDFTGLVSNYMIAERTIELSERFERDNKLTGIGVGSSDVATARQFLIDFENDFGDGVKEQVREAARRYRLYGNTVMQYMVDAGRMSQEQLDMIKATNLQYVALKRIREIRPGESIDIIEQSADGRYKLNERVKGSNREIQDVYQSLIVNLYQSVQESDINTMLDAFVTPLRTIRGLYDGTTTESAFIARQIQLQPNEEIGNRPIYIIYNNGVKEYWEFDKDVYESFNRLINGTQFSNVQKFMMNILGFSTKLLRFTVTKNPVFQIFRNAPRDIQHQMVLSKSKQGLYDLLNRLVTKKPLTQIQQFKNELLALGVNPVNVNKYVKELKISRLKADGMLELYGGSFAGYYTKSKEHFYAAQIRLLRMLSKGNKAIILDSKTLKEGWNYYDEMLGNSEKLSRITEYQQAYKYAITQLGYDEYNASLYAAFQARDLMDFAKIGVYMEFINQILPFANSGVQGMLRTIDGLVNNTGKTMFNTFTYIGVPSIMFYMLAKAYDYDKEYESLPAWQKDFFYNFKIPSISDRWIMIPKPFEIGVLGTFYERLLTYHITDNYDKAFDGYIGSLSKGFFHFDEFSFTFSLKPIIENITNYNSFRDANIIPVYEEQMPLPTRPGKNKGSMMGNVIGDLIGVDSRKVDHAIKGYFSYYGDWSMKISDMFRPETMPSKETDANIDIFSFTSLVRDVKPTSLQLVSKIVDTYYDFKLQRTPDGMVLSNLLDSYKIATSEEEKERLTNDIIDLTDKLYPSWNEKLKVLEKALDGEEVEYNGLIINKQNLEYFKNDIYQMLFNTPL